MTAAKERLSSGTRVLVIGLGRSGRSTLATLQQRQIHLTATDDHQPTLTAAASALTASDVSVAYASQIVEETPSYDLAILSPGVPQTSPIVQAMRRANIPIIGEIEAAALLTKASIVAITGTKGKSTTTALVGELFRTADCKTYVGGNIGNPLIAEAVKAEENAWLIAEVSSFQLETIVDFKPRISVLLNLSPDHLDRYHDEEEYYAAKFRIFSNQDTNDTFIANLDDPRVAALTENARTGPRCICRGFSRYPHRGAELFVDDESIIWQRDPQSRQRLIGIDELPLLGAHNVSNTLAALLVGLTAGLPVAPLIEGVRKFGGLAHRLSIIGEVNGVRYIDDSKATNPDSVIAALEAFNTPLVLIAGGRNKGTDFTALAGTIRRQTRAVVLLGESAAEIAANLREHPIQRAQSMEEAVELAASIARPGDTVLLSPGCASFDMFASAEARGDAFASAVSTRLRTRS